MASTTPFPRIRPRRMCPARGQTTRRPAVRWRAVGSTPAAEFADSVIVTDDNPRSEDPAAVRSEIMAEAPGAIEIGDRSMAIAKAVSMLEEGDTLIVAGKGHEEGQTIGDKVLPFSDHAEIRKAMENVRSSQWLWASSEMVKAMGGRPVGALPEGVNGISIDSRSVKRGEAFFAIKGDRVDGHDYASSAMANGAGVLVVSEAKLPAMGHLQVPLIVVDNVLEALERLAVASRRRSEARIIAVTGSVGKTTTKEMLRQLLSAQGKTHASVASFNNHWGVPLTLARMPRDTHFGVFEIGMNHPGEIRPLVKMVRPHIAIITAIASAHLGFFKNLGEIAAAKAEIFEGVEPDGHVFLNRDSEKFTALKKAALANGITNIHSFGEHKQSDIQLLNVALKPGSSHAVVEIDKQVLEFEIGIPGRHIVQNALAVLGAAKFAGCDLDEAAAAFAVMEPAAGRGARHQLEIEGGSFTLIDESYNANPASMRAALELLRDTPARLRGRRGPADAGQIHRPSHGDQRGRRTPGGSRYFLQRPADAGAAGQPAAGGRDHRPARTRCGVEGQTDPAAARGQVGRVAVLQPVAADAHEFRDRRVAPRCARGRARAGCRQGSAGSPAGSPATASACRMRRTTAVRHKRQSWRDGRRPG